MPVLMFANFFISSFSMLLVPEYSRLLAGKNYKRMKAVCNKILCITFTFPVSTFINAKKLCVGCACSSNTASSGVIGLIS